MDALILAGGKGMRLRPIVCACMSQGVSSLRDTAHARGADLLSLVARTLVRSTAADNPFAQGLSGLWRSDLGGLHRSHRAA